MIKNIDINKIHHHPDNPRKELGDITELADSIKANGVLQNLTLVPIEGKEGEYYAVIGNRRLAASKLAGLTVVPAAIIEMDHTTQVKIMLLENMQRSDLTPYEEAQGFQMLMDLGESVANISETTGFSETTVRRRVKLLELDQEKLKEASGRGATLQEYMELEKIEDLKIRNEVLEKVGTEDFRFSLKNAIQSEKRKKGNILIEEKFSTFAKKIKQVNYSKMSQVAYHRGEDIDSNNIDKKVKIPKDSKTAKYFYEVSMWAVTLYKENEKTNVKREVPQHELDRKRKEKELKNISGITYELRKDFIKNISSTAAKKSIKLISEKAVWAMSGYFNYAGIRSIIELLDLQVDVPEEEREDKYKDIDIKYIEEYIYKQPERILLVSTFLRIDDGREVYFDYGNRHKKNKNLDNLYNLLEGLGYEMSEEERKLQDGTHELFQETKSTES